jgi:hypothetical protein
MERRTSDTRDCLDRFEGDALAGTLQEGPSIDLLALEAGRPVAEHEIRWDRLASWLTGIHSCASRLAD